MGGRAGKPAKQQAPSSDLDWPGAGQEVAFRRALIRWFRRHQRDLPWREQPDGYRIWVSEIMLQQTQVATVVAYYQRFLQRFPEVNSLAEADESEVLKLWEGLGYYRRARQLHAAARQIVARHGGEFPSTFADVLALPGVGRYTAGAIMSIAFDQPQPILEGNTIRVFARLLGMTECAREKASEQRLWSFSQSLLPPGEGSRDLNQGLMELGSELCRVRQPACLLCPVSRWCRAFAEGIQDQLPVLTPRMEYVPRQDGLVLIRRGRKLLLRKCAEGEHWTGLWDFPRVTLAEAAPQPVSPQVSRLAEQAFQRELGLSVAVEPAGKRLKHAVTKYRITLDCFWGKLQGRVPKGRGEWAWVAAEELPRLALNATGRKVADWLAEAM
ncbi:MAG: A/G-specific adenine glycosylase [Planctomycetota bacterium]